MWARTQLKIGWSDLLSGGLACFLPRDQAKVRQNVESYFPDKPNVIAAYSVRSGFDLLLQALELREGDEVLYSALNIKGMVTIARRAGLIPIPVDLDLERASPSLEILEAAVSPRSKVIVVAHLFGTRLNMQPIVDFAQKHKLLLVEDCAQAFSGRAYTGHSDANLAMFSFGPLKTATALGGALIIVKDPELCTKMRQIQQTYPVQKQLNHFKRVLQFAALKFITSRHIMNLIYKFFSRRGHDYEDALSNNVRNVAPLGKSKQLRYQPSVVMLSLMERRLKGFVENSLQIRANMGQRLRNMLEGAVVLPGQACEYHDYWVFPILVDDPEQFIQRLRQNGFDGANLPRSQTVAPPEYAKHLFPKLAEQMLSSLIIVPCYPGMPDKEILREAELLKKIANEVGSSRTKTYADFSSPGKDDYTRHQVI